jgi:uncharacterized protein YbjQ (UPF0145 family)
MCFMASFDGLDPADVRFSKWERALNGNKLPDFVLTRLNQAKTGTAPWLSTMTPAELLLAKTHGIKPLATVSGTCWYHYGWSWTEGHAEGWNMALRRIRQEAVACGANAVVDVHMRTIARGENDSMDFTLLGTAVRFASLPPASEPIVATVPALEFVKLLEADVVPTGIAIGAHYEWLADYNRSARMTWRGNIESQTLSELWEVVRQRAHQNLRSHARTQGNGVLAHLNFSQMFESEKNKVPQYLARQIVVATTVDAKRGTSSPHDIKIMVDIHAGGTPLTGTKRHHQSYESDEAEGAI